MSNYNSSELHKIRERWQEDQQQSCSSHLHLISVEKNSNISNLMHFELVTKVSIYNGSIIDLRKIDGIVNPANSRLWADGSGVCGAIFRIAGYNELQSECEKITLSFKNNLIPNGQTVVTNGYKSYAKYILHTITPPSSFKNNKQLMSCYISSMEQAIIYNIRTIAFPCIATGDAGFNKQVITYRPYLGCYPFLYSKTTKKLFSSNVLCIVPSIYDIHK